MNKTGLPQELKEAKYIIEWFMTDCCDLKPLGEVIFEVCNWRKMCELAAYGGFPIRYPHYQWGLDFYELFKEHEYRLRRIYEMVINNDPCFAYLMEDNKLVDQKLVMAHVYAHADFFANNICFAGTNRKAVDMMANHAVKIKEFQDLHGQEVVEKWLDVCLSLANLIDPYYSVIKRHDKDKKGFLTDEEEEEAWNGYFPAKHYMKDFINPPAELEAHRQWLKDKLEREVDVESKIVFPSEPVRDVLWFLIENAPLQDWQREILLIIREEAYYFVPQGRTKIMNEGWAAFWHSEAMTWLSDSSEIIDYADHNSGTLAFHRNNLNPYLIGREIFRDIFYRWNSHRYGKVYTECDYQSVLDNWDQFVAFKNIQEDGGDWNEFLCFWKEIKKNLSYKPELLLLWWHYYLNPNNLRKFIDKIKPRKRLLARRNLSASIIKEYANQKRFFENFERIKTAFQQGRLQPEKFCIPHEFHLHHQNFPGRLPIGEGRAKIFEVRRTHSDLSFIEEFLTSELCYRLHLLTYKKTDGFYVVDSLEAADIRSALAYRLSNVGQPIITLDDANYDNAHELLLRHHYDDRDLELGHAEATLENLFEVWRRPVHIESIIDGKPVRMIFNGKDHDCIEL